MGAQQSRTSKLTFPAGSVESDPFFETTVKVRDFITATMICDRLSFMIEPDSTTWFLCKRFVDWNTPTPRHVGTLGYRVKDIFVRDDNMYIVTDRRRYPNSSVDQQRVFVYKKRNDNTVVDQENDLLTVLTESFSNPLKHPFLDVLNEFLVKKEETEKVSENVDVTVLKERHGTLPPTNSEFVVLAFHGTLSKFTLTGLEPKSEVFFEVNHHRHTKGVANEDCVATVELEHPANLDRISVPRVWFKPTEKPITYHFEA